jgi:phenylacetate-CoA ligase
MIDRESLRSNQWHRLSSLLSELLPSQGFYGIKLRQSGLIISDVGSWKDFAQKVPFTKKAELLADHLAFPPFGSNLTQPLSDYTRFCQTSGTSSGQSMAYVDTAESWEDLLSCWHQVYAGAELVRGEDRLFFAFSFGPFLGFWTAYEAASRDFIAIPSGGLSSQARLEMMASYAATTLCCTPTYALRLGEMIGSVSGVHLSALKVKKIIVAGEPGGSIPEVRSRIERLWNARVYDHHGMTEVGPVSYEMTAMPSHLIVMEEAYFAEVINPQTGQEVADGDQGELVLTNLKRTACPLIRYRTGDWVKKRIVHGRLTLEGGVIGRVDDMVVVRGVNVYPSAIDSVVRQFPEVVEYLVQQQQVDAMHEIELLIEVPDAAAASLVKKLETKLRDTFSLRIPVKLAELGSLPRHEFKAKRWRVIG